MNFGDILEQWENSPRKERKGRERRTSEFEKWLYENPPLGPKEADLEEEADRQGPGHRAIRRMEPQDTIDLHGYTLHEALQKTEAFLRSAKRRGLKKVLIIHGKGTHSREGESVLKQGIRKYLQESPLCGEIGVPKSSLGGTGAVWVAVRTG